MTIEQDDWDWEFHAFLGRLVHPPELSKWFFINCTKQVLSDMCQRKNKKTNTTSTSIMDAASPLQVPAGHQNPFHQSCHFHPQLRLLQHRGALVSCFCWFVWDFFSFVFIFFFEFFRIFTNTKKSKKNPPKPHRLTVQMLPMAQPCSANAKISCASLSLAVRQVRFLAPKLARACRNF